MFTFIDYIFLAMLFLCLTIACIGLWKDKFLIAISSMAVLLATTVGCQIYSGLMRTQGANTSPQPNRD